MSDQPPTSPGFLSFRTPAAVASGVYATAVIVANTREEFFLDFLSTYTVPTRLLTRVILHPAHAKRLAQALRQNLEVYQEKFGQIPTSPLVASAAASQPVADMYSKFDLPETVVGGVYTNTALVRYTREEFVLDFMLVMQPPPVLTARVLMSPPHILRLVKALNDRLQTYEATVGSLMESPPDSAGSGPRFSLS